MQKKEFLTKKRANNIEPNVVDDSEESDYDEMSLPEIRRKKQAIITRKSAEEAMLVEMEETMTELESEKIKLKEEKEEKTSQGQFPLLKRTEETVDTLLRSLNNMTSSLSGLLRSIRGVNRANTEEVDTKLENLEDKIKDLEVEIEKKKELLTSLERRLTRLSDEIRLKDINS